MQMLCRREQISPIGWHRLHVIIYTLLVVSLFPFCNTSRIMMLLDRRNNGILQRPQVTEYRVQSTENRGKRTENRVQSTEYRVQRKEERGKRTEYRVQRTENREQRTENRGKRKETFFVFIFALSSLLFHFSLFPLTSAHYLHACNHLNLITLHLQCRCADYLNNNKNIMCVGVIIFAHGHIYVSSKQR